MRSHRSPSGPSHRPPALNPLVSDLASIPGSTLVSPLPATAEARSRIGFGCTRRFQPPLRRLDHLFPGPASGHNVIADPQAPPRWNDGGIGRCSGGPSRSTNPAHEATQSIIARVRHRYRTVPRQVLYRLVIVGKIHRGEWFSRYASMAVRSSSTIPSACGTRASCPRRSALRRPRARAASLGNTSQTFQGTPSASESCGAPCAGLLLRREYPDDGLHQAQRLCAGGEGV